ncbi:MAG TPA: AI-2E family transporter [Candidatus Binataceae bacterium]|nr:AI-2E family transporter [Candidatus Binataceae bacterium]
MNQERLVQIFFFGLLALITWQLCQVLDPFLMPIAWAILLAFLAHPALCALNRRVHSRTTAAVIITVIVALGVILPAIWLSARLLREAQTLYSSLSTFSASGSVSHVGQLLRSTTVGQHLDLMLARHGIRLDDEITRLANQAAKLTSAYVLAHGSSAASNLAEIVLHFGIALLTFFYLLRDGEGYYAGLRALAPMDERDKAAVFETLRATLSSVMRGLMLTAVLDGITIGLGYLVCGVPYWAFLALLTGAGGLLPLGGTAVVWIPVAIYLGVMVSWSSAAILVAWAMVVLAIIDNFFKPLAMRHGTDLPTIALFFGLAGGIEAYGPIGIFAGPAVFAIFSALIKVYRRTYVLEFDEPAGAPVEHVPAAAPGAILSPPAGHPVREEEA